MTDPTFRLGSTVLDSKDPGRLARFYGELLGWEIGADEPEWVTLRPPGGGAGLSFQLEPLHVAPTWPAQEGAEQMQLHLDIVVDDLDEAVTRAVDLGATVEDVQLLDDVRVMRDPEGHVFCLFPPGA